MSELLRLAATYFEERAWKHSAVPGREDLIEVVFENPRAHWRSYARAYEGDAAFVFFSVSPQNVPEDRRPAAAEFMTRVNFGLVTGKFEMDWEDGEARFETGLEMRGVAPTMELIEALVQPNLSAINRYLPGLMMVIAGDADPAAARAECEEDG